MRFEQYGKRESLFEPLMPTKATRSSTTILRRGRSINVSSGEALLKLNVILYHFVFAELTVDGFNSDHRIIICRNRGRPRFFDRISSLLD